MGLQNITPQQLDELKDQEGYVLLDVRAPEEKVEGFIEGAAMINFFDPTFRDDIDELDRSKHYLIYCRSGNRSGQVCMLMEDMGFDHTYNLAGGIKAWNQYKG